MMLADGLQGVYGWSCLALSSASIVFMTSKRSLLRLLLGCPHKGTSISLSAVNLSMLDFQAPESTDWQIDRFGLFVSPSELKICQSLDLISTISERILAVLFLAFTPFSGKQIAWYVLFYLAFWVLYHRICIVPDSRFFFDPKCTSVE